MSAKGGAEVRWSSDPAPFEWILPLLDRDQSVCMRVPHGFEAYVRVLHPLKTRDQELSWREVARRNGNTLDRTSGWQALAIPAPGAPSGVGPDESPELCATPRQILEVLMEHLTVATATPFETWGACWDGYGGGSGNEMRVGPSEDAATVNFAGGNLYHVFTGPMADIDALDPLTPNLWWPADRAWSIGRYFYETSTYVAGSSRLVESILNDTRLEALEVEPTDVVDTY